MVCVSNLPFLLLLITCDIGLVNVEVITILFRSLPKISREDFELIFDELDDSHDFKVLPFSKLFLFFVHPFPLSSILRSE